jgi:uncharacterized protein YbjQ (UPF0145 family)
MDSDDIRAAFFMLFFYIVMPLLLLGGTWLTQHMIVRSRRKFLSAREAYYRERIQMTNLKHFPDGNGSSPALVSGAAVIAGNYFVSFVSLFRHLFGGELKGYTGMCSDARRLALVRMLYEAERMGADAVCNIRFETSTINSAEQKQKAAGVELIVYGTAFRRTRP